MIDAFDLPAKTRQITYVGTEVSGLPPINIQVPKDARFVFFTIIGGGGGGGRPTAGAAASGAGGGGVGGITRGLFMAKELPPELYGYISRRGAGATTNGGVGGNGLGVRLAAVAGTSQPNAQDILLFANGGGGGRESGVAGSAGAAATAAGMMLSTSALWVNATAGQSGGAGAIGNGADVAIAASNFCSAGAGGAGSNVASSTGGRQVSSSVLYPSLAASASDGLAGYIIQRPFICIGGCGGGGTSGATGFNGGNAAYIGAGGGGGGNGVTTSGNGGDGGSGAIIMRWW